jgi:hypothetical protein
MKRNIFFEIVLEPEDFVPLLMHELNNEDFHNVYVKENTDHGFSTTVKLPSQGIYIIYKNKQPIYIGCSTNSIHTRIGRFIAGVRGTERIDENHSAAYKYIEVFGQDLTGVSIKAVSLRPSDLPDYLNVESIERMLILKLKPLFNNETHYDYVFEKGVKVFSSKEQKDARFI